jgi:DNA-binding NarL/FixJ family response regulator
MLHYGRSERFHEAAEARLRMCDPVQEIPTATSGDNRFRVLLADESPAVLVQLREELEPLQSFEIIGEAATSREALRLFFQYRPHVLVVSICLPDQNGFEVLKCIKRAFPDCAVILTTRWANSFVEQTARLLGATGTCATTEGLTQIREILQRQFEASS